MSSDKLIEKVVIYILRIKKNRQEILVFDHVKYPEVSQQVPAGTVELNEDLQLAAIRELYEESGVKLAALQLAGSYVFFGIHSGQFQERNIFVSEASEALKDEWIHTVSGKGDDQNLQFKYYWMPIEEAHKSLKGRLADGFIFCKDYLRK